MVLIFRTKLIAWGVLRVKVLYIPIDERPCNIQVVERIANTNNKIQLSLPPNEYLGNKKSAAHTEKIWDWINENAAEVNALILSIDMLIYGGLLPSRLHYLTENNISIWMKRLRSLRKKFPNLRIYASSLIMRTPRYSSSDEEPDYYEHWGREIFLQAYLIDKQKQESLSLKEKEQLKGIQHALPKEFVEDYETRRKFNLLVNQHILDLVKEEVIDFLVIPQDDSAEYGYTALDQKKVIAKRNQLRLFKQVLIYPGADEVGATLLTRVYNDINGYQPKIFPIWSSTLGPTLIPMYEDRPFAESMKSHVYAAGCQLIDDAFEADLILAYNVPGRVMQEAWDQPKRDVSYSSFRNLLMFVEEIKRYIDAGKQVIVADSAFANGGDGELITLLDEEKILDKLLSYKGWNTNCNTLGTTIAQGVIGLRSSAEEIVENVLYHLLDDYFYQARVRMDMVDHFLPMHELDYFDLKDKQSAVNKEKDRRLLQEFKEGIKHSFQSVQIEQLKTTAPWNRMFETGMDLKIKHM